MLEDFSTAIGVLAAEWELLSAKQQSALMSHDLVRQWRDKKLRYRLSLDDYRAVWRILSAARRGGHDGEK